MKDKFGKERENSDKIDRPNQLPTINKECKGDVNERSCNNLDESDGIRFENVKSEIKNIFKGKGEKRKKAEIRTKIKVKQRSRDTNINTIIHKNEAEKKAKYYGGGEKDEEGELKKITLKNLL